MPDTVHVQLQFDRLFNLHGFVVNKDDHDRIVDGMVKNGADPVEYGASLLFVQGYEASMEALATLLYADPDVTSVDPETVEFEMPFPVDAVVDEWTFRHLCGYQSD